METPCTFNIYRTWNPTNVEEVSSMIYLPYDGCWILYNCMELSRLDKINNDARKFFHDRWCPKWRNLYYQLIKN